MSKLLSAYEKVNIARDIKRPKTDDYIEHLFTDFTELKGDRLGKEDKSLLCGIGLFEGVPVTVIGHRKGNNLEENLEYNFGMPSPEGYRKSHRLMKLSEKYKRPVITFVDTPGAYPGKEAEENGQSVAIAENLLLMSMLKVPVITFITGEGNSGGALAIAASDKVYMFENSVYSILSPEGFASILWKDASKKEVACEMMKMTAGDLYSYGLVDGVLPEPEGGLQKNPKAAYEAVREKLRETLPALMGLSGEELKEKRYEKIRNIKRDL
ncbi:MAG: acetyl-CoA carboxylase carboxyltransferase subunit alpha [Eubacterium sp.]|nr:acetyl-CoA carboxylase carboxyltransferase subunit alpha [Eubacterium sp.]